MTNCCAIFGCTPEAFPWGWDEENETCAAMKLVLLNRITLLRAQGVTRFCVSMDCGVWLYAAEIIQGLREADKELETVCYVPYEEQATKWTSALRERYFNVLAACTEVVNVAYEKTVGCKFKAHLEAMNEADAVIMIYDPDDPLCEREVAAGVVGKMLGKQFQIIDPKTIKLS